MPSFSTSPSVFIDINCDYSYDHKRGIEGLLNIADGEDEVEERGDSIAVVADNGQNKAVTFEDSDRGDDEDLDDDISYVSCRCGNQGGCLSKCTSGFGFGFWRF